MSVYLLLPSFPPLPFSLLLDVSPSAGEQKKTTEEEEEEGALPDADGLFRNDNHHSYSLDDDDDERTDEKNRPSDENGGTLIELGSSLSLLSSLSSPCMPEPLGDQEKEKKGTNMTTGVGEGRGESVS